MKKLPNGSIVEIPKHRPPTAVLKNFHDTLMKAETLDADEVKLLGGVLDHYDTT